MKYTIEIYPDPQPDPQGPSSDVWVSQILDCKGQVIDGHGDIHGFETAKSLAISTLERLITN